jgi:hypothetical protein
LRKSCFGLIVSIARRIRQAPSDPTPKANTLETMETISNMTVGGVPLNTLAIVITIGVSVVWLWSRWDARQARKRQVKDIKRGFKKSVTVRELWSSAP